MLSMYGVRLRDIRSGAERWLQDDGGERFLTSSRWVADLTAYGLTDTEAWMLPQVVEIDLRSEVMR